MSPVGGGKAAVVLVPNPRLPHLSVSPGHSLQPKACPAPGSSLACTSASACRHVQPPQR